MTKAGFSLDPGSNRPGTWVGPDGIVIDLMVPAAVGGAGRRGARLGVHGNLVASKGRGLEGVLIDNEPMTITASTIAIADESICYRRRPRCSPCRQAAQDRRSTRRHQTSRRQGRAGCVPPAPGGADSDLASRMRRLLGDSRSREVTEEALVYLMTMFGTPDGAGSRMAARAVEMLEDPDTIAAACAVLADSCWIRFAPDSHGDILKYRPHASHRYVGRYTHHLVDTADGLRIRHKRINLAGADGYLPPLSFLLVTNRNRKRQGGTQLLEGQPRGRGTNAGGMVLCTMVNLAKCGRDPGRR